MNNNTVWTSPISAESMKKLCDETFSRFFPEVVQMERCENEHGKITEDDLRRIFHIK